MTREAVRGLEKLRHALQYLADGFVCEGCPVAEDYGRVQAIQLLASLNREIYFAYANQPTLGDRIRAVAHRFLKSEPPSEIR